MNVKKKLIIEHPLIELMKKYILNDVNELHEIVYQPFIPEGIKFDRSLHYNLDFITMHIGEYYFYGKWRTVLLWIH